MSISITVSGGWKNLTGTIALTGIPVNDFPVVSNPLPPRYYGVQNFAFNIPSNTFLDVDGDPLSYTVRSAGGLPLPSWLTFQTSTFSGTPSSTDEGTYVIEVTAADGKGGSVSLSFSVQVSSLRASNYNQDVTYTEDVSVDLGDISVLAAAGNINVTLTLDDVRAGIVTTPSFGPTVSSFDSSKGIWGVVGPPSDVSSIPLCALQQLQPQLPNCRGSV